MNDVKYESIPNLLGAFGFQNKATNNNTTPVYKITTCL